MSLRKSNTAKGNRDCPKTKQEAVRDGQPLCFLCFLNLTQCLAKLVGTRGRSVSASDAFQLLDDILYLHTFHQLTDSLKVSVASSPKKDFADYSVFYFQFDVTATSTLRLVSEFLYHYSSSAGFNKLLIITVSILFLYLCSKINQNF